LSVWKKIRRSNIEKGLSLVSFIFSLPKHVPVPRLAANIGTKIRILAIGTGIEYRTPSPSPQKKKISRKVLAAGLRHG